MARALRTLLILILGAAPAAADVVCRPDALGTVSCPAGPRPAPRPPLFRFDLQALERVLSADQARPGQTFVPARETSRLGGTTVTKGGGSLCRPDALGNLNCR